jgi:cbb3-type cytochrome oxidase subunit 3
MDMENIKKWLKIVAIFLYCFIAVIASAGAMNRGYETHEWIYFVAGGVNLILAIYTAYREYKKSQEG